MNPPPSSSPHKTLNSHLLYQKALKSSSLPTNLPPIPPSIPQSNLIPSTRFIIDGFKHSGPHSITYFLSHFHSDHYTSLSQTWSHGLIFCSHLTSQLLIQSLQIPKQFIIPLSLCNTITIDNIHVTLIDANHCPGAVQFLFKFNSPDGICKKYLHTGDFRFKNSMKFEPLIKDFIGSDAVFLDTTYCHPKFVFPEQDESVNYIVNTIQKIRNESRDVLVLVATYVIGKEKILTEIAKRCCCKIYVDAKKMRILSVLGFEKSGVFTEDASISNVHVVGWNVLGETWPYFRPNFGKMKEVMLEKGYEKVVGFVPTGWMYEARRDGFAVRSKEELEIHLVPYSEHSSYDELREYVKFLKPKQVVPTVGMDIEKLDSKHVVAMRKHFAGLVDEMANKKEFLKGFHRRRNVKKDERGEDDIISEELTQGSNCDKEVEPVKELSESAASVQEMDSEDVKVSNENSTDTPLEELRLFLPVWVTQDQIAELLNSSSGSVVEAVSQFYERETELHKEVTESDNQTALSKTTSSSTSSVVPETGSNTSSAANSNIVLTPKPSVRNTTTKSLTNILCSNKKLPATKKSTKVTVSPKKRGSPSSDKKSKVTVSPKKRGSQPDKTSNKKARSCSTTESTGSKQTAITKFFSKLEHGASALELGGPKQTAITKFFCKPVASTSEACEASTSATEAGGSTLNSLSIDVPEQYKDNLAQFLEVTEGSVSESEAASLLEKAKGDLAVALDIYCRNSVGNSDEKEKIPFCSESDKVQSCENEKNSCKETSNNMSILPVQGFSTENANASLILLPLEKYSPVEHACWQQGQPAPYLHIARAFELVEGERGKIKATGMLCNMFRSLLVLSPEDVLPTVYLCTNKIAPDHANMELNIGGSLVCSALEEACGTNKNKIREMYNSLGDLGDVAQVCRQTQTLLVPPSPLTIQEVFSALRKMSLETGQGSTIRKKSLIARLMRSCREKEIKFLVRTLVRNLRIGAMMRTVLPALAQAVVIHSSQNLLQDGPAAVLKEKLQVISAAVVEAYNVLPDLDLLIPSLISKGLDFSSSTLSMVPGIPVRPMLARITNGASQAIKQFQGRAFTCEYKYDGQRAQIHKLEDGSIKVFSRNGDETTSKFPDLINIIEESCKPAATTFILDAEVVAVDRKNGCKLMSFQELSSRERGNKNSLISLDSIKVDICVFVFDIMFANAERLLDLPLRQRRKYFKNLFNEEKLGHFEYAKEITVEAEDACLESQETLARVNSFFEEAFNSSCEGIMVKSLDVDAIYAASKRSESWLKVKRDYLEGYYQRTDGNYCSVDKI